MKAIFEYFELGGRGSSFAQELRGACATFLTMAYILAANPTILATAGVPRESAAACTAAAAGVSCILMGLAANFPIALASGMGLNALLASMVLTGSVDSWQAAMGLVVWDGAIIFVLVGCGLREAVMHAIPRDLRLAIGAGIGLFIAFIGAVNARIVVVPTATIDLLAAHRDAVMPPVTFGSLRDPQALVALAGLVVTAFLLARRVRGALVWGILLSTAMAVACGIAKLPDAVGWPSLELVGQARVFDVLRPPLVPLLLTLILVDFFDTLGTVTAISQQAGLQDSDGRIPRLRRVLLVDSASAAIGGLFGVSSVTSYIESASGVAEGARTGLHSVLVGVMFLAAIFLAPLAAMVPAAATAPALMLVGFLMSQQLTRIDFAKLETAIPAFVTLVMLPMTYSITHGVGYGFVTYVLIRVLSGQWRAVHPLLYGSAVLFAAYFAWA
jgi:AGZA family xanthine/uracil permease-like MFS transporter